MPAVKAGIFCVYYFNFIDAIKSVQPSIQLCMHVYCIYIHCNDR